MKSYCDLPYPLTMHKQKAKTKTIIIIIIIAFTLCHVSYLNSDYIKNLQPNLLRKDNDLWKVTN